MFVAGSDMDRRDDRPVRLYRRVAKVHFLIFELAVENVRRADGEKPKPLGQAVADAQVDHPKIALGALDAVRVVKTAPLADETRFEQRAQTGRVKKSQPQGTCACSDSKKRPRTSVSEYSYDSALARH